MDIAEWDHFSRSISYELDDRQDLRDSSQISFPSTGLVVSTKYLLSHLVLGNGGSTQEQAYDLGKNARHRTVILTLA